MASSSEENNKAALRKFYEKKDPNRVKNVDPMFLRFDEVDILWHVEHKYGESVEGWVTESRGTGHGASTDGRKSGFFGSAKSLLSVGSRKSIVKSPMNDGPMRESLGGSFDTRINRVDSDDSDADSGVHPSNGTLLPPTSPVAIGPSKTVSEVKVEAAISSGAGAPSAFMTEVSAETNVDVSAPMLTREEVDAKMDEIKAREREALEAARAEERRIHEALARGREAIERAKRELEEKERELEEVKRKMDAEARAEKAKNNGEVAAAPAAAAAEEFKKAQEEVEKKQIETIGKLEVAERERIELEEKKHILKIEEAERKAKLILIETLNIAENMSKAEAKENEEEKAEAEDAISELQPSAVPVDEGMMPQAPKRMTLYERKLQAALEAPEVTENKEEEEQPISSGGRKTLLGGLVGRFTTTGKRKTTAQMPSQPTPSPPVVSPTMNELPPVAIVPDVETPPSSGVLSQPATNSAPAPLIAPPVSVVKDLAVDELEQWKLRALEAETRTRVLQMEAEERSKKFQHEAEERIRKLEELAGMAFKQQQQAAAAAASGTPIAPAPAASSSSGPITEENGYKVLPRDHPDLNKFHKMAKAGLPQGAVENAMIREGIHPKSVFDEPLNNPKKNNAAAPAPAAAAPAAATASGGDDGGFKKLAQDSPDLEKYRKMQKAGLPQGAVENAMMRDFIHPASLYGANAINDPKPPPKKAAAPQATPAAASTAKAGGGGDEFKKLPQDSPDLEKYKKMQKAGLPQGAVENAMMRDFIHPASLYGSSAINDPKPKPGGAPAAAAKPAAAGAAPAKPAAAAPSGDPSKPPPGMSMMEEMKWRQAQKAKEGPKQFVEPVKKVEEKPVAKSPLAAPGPNDKPPPGLSMMEEMKWKQAQKAAIAAAGGGPAPIKEPPKKETPASTAPNFKVALKSSGGVPTTAPAPAANKPATSPIPTTATKGVPPPATKLPTSPAPPSWNKAPPTKATVQAASNLAAAPPPPNVDALVALLVGAKISADTAKKYALALANEGFDAPDKLALLDEGDLTACGITARFDIKTIMSLKSNLPKPSAAPPAAGASKPGVPGAAAKPGAVPAATPATKPGAVPPAAAAKPGISSPTATAAAKPGVAAPPATAKPAIGAPAGGVNKPAVASPTPAAAAKPGIPPAASGGGGFQKPALKSGASEQAKREAERMAFVMALGAPVSAYQKPKQV